VVQFGRELQTFQVNLLTFLSWFDISWQIMHGYKEIWNNSFKELLLILKIKGINGDPDGR
jgi:hypothetical protein